MSDIAAVLKEAREFLLRGWCQGCPAQNEKGEKVPPNSNEAISWCATGAISAALDVKFITDSNDEGIRAWLALDTACQSLFNNACVVTWNDEEGVTESDILELYEEAIGWSSQ